MSKIIENFERMLASGQDNALLRFGLGQAYLNQNNFELAREHLQRAVALDANYSAAWKLLGKSLAELKHTDAAMHAYTEGIKIAEQKGDIQAAKEMKVFLKRLQKQTTSD